MKKKNIAKTLERQNDNIVPVICDEVMEFTSADSSKCNIKDYIINYLSEDEPDTPEEILLAFENDFFYGMSLMCSWSESFKQTFYNMLKDEAEIHLKPSIKEYLLKSKTQIILTTFPTNVIETELNNELGHTKYVSKYFCYNRRNDLPIIMNDKVVVYHLFGGQDIDNWACDEDKMLTFLHAFHSDYAPTALLRHINSPDEKKLLVLGSTLPNWLFRFLLYPMYKSQGGFWLSEDKIDLGLKNFLSRKHFEGLAGETDKNETFTYPYVFDNIYKDVTIAPVQERKKAFISYKSEPEGSSLSEAIDNIYTILQNNYNVWYDKNEIRNKLGDPYWKRIKDAITKESDYVFFIVTPRYIQEFKDAPQNLELLRDLTETTKDSAQDPEEITKLVPVVREAYYAIKSKRHIGVIVVNSGAEMISPKEIEGIASNLQNNINLPLCIFCEHNMMVYDDNKPEQLDFQF